MPTLIFLAALGHLTRIEEAHALLLGRNRQTHLVAIFILEHAIAILDRLHMVTLSIQSHVHCQTLIRFEVI